jgi:hypothetical protein
VPIDPSALPTLPSLVAALASALVVLAAAITAVRRSGRGAELARIPLAAQSDLRLDVAGPVVLCGEGPRLTRRFHGLTFRLVDRATGARVPERRAWIRTTVRGASGVRITLVRFDLARPGLYRLELGGLVPPAGDDACALVVTRPSGLALPLAIVTTIGAGATAIAALVGLGWLAFGTTGPAPTMAVPAAASAVAPGSATSARAVASGGRQLHDAVELGAGTADVHWSKGALTLRLPPSFEVRASGDELDARDPRQPSTYLVGHVVTFPPPTTAALLASVAVESAAGRLTSGLLEGYAATRFGGVDGVVTIETRSDGASRMAIWSAYQPTPTGVRNLTVIFGAESAAFARNEGVARAIFASARFD